MVSINSKMGLRPGGRRRMMKLPDDKALRARVTAAVCPECGRRGAFLEKRKTDDEVPRLRCSWCNASWSLEVEA